MKNELDLRRKLHDKLEGDPEGQQMLDDIMDRLVDVETDLGMIQHNVGKLLDEHNWLTDKQYNRGKIKKALRIQ